MQIKNVSGDRRLVPWLGGQLVMPGQVVDLGAFDHEQVFGFTQQVEVWEPADEEAREVHAFYLDVIAYYLAVEGLVEAPVVPDDAEVVRRLLEELNAADLISSVIPELGVDGLTALVEAEEQRAKSRSTVLAAARARIAELAPPPPPPAPDPVPDPVLPDTGSTDETTTDDSGATGVENGA